MSQDELTRLLARAAASVTPTAHDPGRELAERGRRSLRRRRQMIGSGVLSAAVAVTALGVVTAPSPGPFDPGLARSSGAAAAPAGQTVRHGDVSVVVPPGWRVSRTDDFDPCTAQQDTLYLTRTWAPLEGPRAPAPRCPQARVTYMAVVLEGEPKAVNPALLTFRAGRPVQVDDYRQLGAVTVYREFTPQHRPTTAVISGDEATKRRLLDGVTFGSARPVSGSAGLGLPERPTNVLSAARVSYGMVNASDAPTVRAIRAQLAALRDTGAPADPSCDLTHRNSVGLAITDDTDDPGVTVVIGDASCPYAVSTKGGPVPVPADLAERLRAMVVASDRVTSGG